MDLDLECHLNWVNLNTVPDDFMFTLGERNNIWLETTHLNEMSLLSTKMSQWFSMAVHSEWEEEYDEAAEHLDRAGEILDMESENPEVSRYHRSAFRYLIRANRAVLEFRQLGNCRQVEESRQWACEVDIEEDKTRAMILAIKAGVIGFFGDREGRVDLYKKVVELDPDYAEYWKEKFMAHRRIRREKDHLSSPEDVEWECMDKAMEIDGDAPSILNGMTTLLHDCIKDTKAMTRMTVEKHVEELKSCAGKAYSANPECNNSAIRLAEILCISSTGEKWAVESRDMVEAAEAQFKLCLEKWPRSSHVLHKAGKFYFIVRKDYVRGIELIEDSLKDEETNFPSLMDLLRYTYDWNKDEHRSEDEVANGLMDIVDRYLPLHQPRKALSSKLLSIKATILAKQLDFKKALEFWLEAIEIYPDIWIPTPPGDGATRKCQMFGQNVFHKFLHATDFRKLDDFVGTVIDAEPVDSARSERLLKLQAAIQEELTSHNNNRNNVKPRPKPVSESEVDQDWRSRSDSRDQSDRSDSNGDSSDYLAQDSFRSTNRNYFDEFQPPVGRQYYGPRQDHVSSRSAPSYCNSWGTPCYSYYMERIQGPSRYPEGSGGGQPNRHHAQNGRQSRPPPYGESDKDDNWRRK